jgi:hypothetical protein
VIPRRWLPFVKEAAFWGAHPTRDRAQALIDADRASSRRKSLRTLPGRKAKAAKKGTARSARSLARSGGPCEACRAVPGSEAHHLLSGPSRRSQEAPDTMVWICRGCHRDAHEDPLTFWRWLHVSYCWVELRKDAREAVTRRAEKATSLGTGPRPR